MMVCNEKFNKIFTLEHKVIIENKKLIEENKENNSALKYYNEQVWKEKAIPVDVALNHISVALGAYNGDKCIAVGHNVKFDLGFLEYNFNKYNIKNPFYFNSLDTLSLMLYYGVVIGEPLKGYSLENVCKRFKVKHNNPHTAMGDVEAVYNLICTLKSRNLLNMV